MPKKIIDLISRNKTLTLILVIAMLLRLIGIYPGYHPYHSDEGMSYSSAIEMIKRVNIDPGRYDYPSLIPLIHGVVYLVFFLPPAMVISFLFSPENIPSFKNLFDLIVRFLVVNQQTQVLFWGRFVTAIFGIGVVLLVYLVAIRYFQDKRIGLIAAFLTAANFRQVLNSHLGLPDIYNAFFMLLSFFAFSYLLKKPSLKNYLFSGIAISLYFSTKFQVFTGPAFLIIHIYYSLKSTKNKFSLEFFKNFLNGKILITTIAGLLIILAINYTDLIHWKQFQDINSYNLLKYGVGSKQFNFYPISYLYHIGIGPLIFISIILGIILGFGRYTFKTIILISAVVPFMYFFLYYSRGGYYTRNFVTITPLLLIFAALFIVNFWTFLLKSIKWSNLLILITAVFFSYSQIINSIVVASSYTKPWGFEQAKNWASINIPNGTKVVSHPWDKYPRDKDYEIIPLEPSIVFSLAEMREEGAEFGFINMDWLTLSSYWWMNKGIKTSIEFWEKPNDIMANTFSAVAAQELASFSVAKFVKPWQAPDMNFLLVKIPPVPEIKDKILISNFSFDKGENLGPWSLIDGDWSNSKKIHFDLKTGKNSPGSLKFDDGTRRFPVVRAMSPVSPIEKGKAIIVEGWIKSGNILDKKTRDGVLRVDFYKDDPGRINLTTEALMSNVSSRFFGSTDWVKKDLIVVPPENARFMSVGVQVNNFTDFWFDDIKVFQSVNEFEDPRRAAPFIDYKIPDDILFPYSQGGL